MHRAIFVLLLLGASAGGAQDASFERELAEFFEAESVSDRDEAAERLLALEPDEAVLRSRLRTGRAYGADVDTGHLDWNRNGTGGRHEYVVLVPEDYDPSKRYRTSFYLHGGVNRRERWNKGEDWWRRFDRFDGIDQISVFPASWNASLWWQPSQIENLYEILDRIKSAYNVDENQVFLYGVSDGGTAVYYYAMKVPTIWAGFFAFLGHPSVLSNPTTGVFGELFEVNIVNKPLFAVNGEADRLYPAARVLPYIQSFREEGAEIVFRARPGGHNTRWWNGESRRMERFMTEHVRDPLPERLVWETEDTEMFGRVHWLVIEELRDGEPAGGLFPHAKSSGRVTVDRRDNLFEVATIGVARFTLLLSADEIDFGAPIKVVTNGLDSFEGMVEPAAETLLRWAAKDNDRTMLFSAELTIEVP